VPGPRPASLLKRGRVDPRRHPDVAVRREPQRHAVPRRCGDQLARVAHVDRGPVLHLGGPDRLLSEHSRSRELVLDGRPGNRVVHVPEHIEVRVANDPLAPCRVLGRRGETEPTADLAVVRGRAVQIEEPVFEWCGLSRRIDVDPERDGLGADLALGAHSGPTLRRPRPCARAEGVELHRVAKQRERPEAERDPADDPRSSDPRVFDVVTCDVLQVSSKGVEPEPPARRHVREPHGATPHHVSAVRRSVHVLGVHRSIVARAYGVPPVGAFLDRLGRFAARRHWLVIGVWVVLAIAIVSFARASGGHTFDDFTIPGAQSQTAVDLLETRFPQQSGGTATVVIHARQGTLESTAAEAAIAQTVAALKQLPQDPQVTGPVPSPRGDTALVELQYGQQVQQLGVEAFDDLERAADSARKAGLQVAFGGPLVDYAEAPRSSASDQVGLLFAIVILVFAFGSFIAAGLPIFTALIGLAIGLSGITLLAAITDVGTAAPELGTMIGLGVGIDYSLFIITRHRENLAAGMDVEPAVGRAVATAGQAVLFAGTTVVIAICGLLISGIPYVAVLGFAAAIVVAVMMVAAITLLPALLGLVGARVARGRHAAAAAGGSAFWARWATTVARHPWPFAIVAVIVLLTLAAPFLSIRYGQSDDGTAPSGSTQRTAFDLIADGYGPGANGPLVVVVTYAKGGSVPPALVSALKSTPGVAAVAPAETNPGDNTAVVTVEPTTAPDDQATSDLVATLRSQVIPTALAGSPGIEAYVGGITASYIDVGDRIAERLPYFIGAVVLLSFVLLLIVFRSVVIPATAAVMNLLSVGAAYGVTVAVFQWGWFKGLFGLESTIPIISFVPMMMFAVLFGLSMDYQVFLLTRVREEYDKTGDTRTAVVTALSHTARVITSAALIMIVVFLSFVAYPIPEVKMFGLGLAVAVAVDSTIVRMVLVPSLMEIFGKANWWFPAWLSRIVPKITIE